MEQLTAKKRVGIVIGVVFLYIPLAIGGLWMATHLLKKYLAFSEAIVFSSLFVYGVTCFLVLLPLIVLSAYPVFMGIPIPIKKQKILGKYIAACLVLTVVSQISTKLYFEQIFAKQGYLMCSGTPHTWMPGMATRYVKDFRLCHQ